MEKCTVIPRRPFFYAYTVIAHAWPFSQYKKSSHGDIHSLIIQFLLPIGNGTREIFTEC